MDLTVRLTCVKGKVKSDSRFDLIFAKDQMCSKSNFSSRVTGNPIFPSYKTMSRKISKYYRFSNDNVACGVDRDVMTAYSSLSSGHEVEWLPPQLPKKASSMQ